MHGLYTSCSCGQAVDMGVIHAIISQREGIEEIECVRERESRERRGDRRRERVRESVRERVRECVSERE